MTPPNTDGWSEAEMHVLKELERLSDGIETLHGRVNLLADDLKGRIGEINVDVGKLQVKAGLWGVAGGALVLLVPELLKRMFGG